MVFHLEFKPKHKASIYLILIILCFVNMSCIKKSIYIKAIKMIMKIQKKPRYYLRNRLPLSVSSRS